MTSRPEIPAVARLLEAATTLRQQAARLRAAHPDRRAVSAAAQVAVAADGRLLEIRVLDGHRLRTLDVAAHVQDLVRAAMGESVEAVVVEDLPADAASGATGLGPGRFAFPPGIDDDAAPEQILAQVDRRLRSRFEAAERTATRVMDADGMATSADGAVSIRLGALGQLLELRLTGRLLQEPLDHINDVIHNTLEGARTDLRDQIEQYLQEGE